MVEVEIAAVDPATGALLGAPLTTTLLVDSGADRTVIDDGLAATLGIDLTACATEPVIGVSGNIANVATSVVKMHLVGRWMDVPVYFIPGNLLLGREVVFDAIYLGFAHHQGYLLAASYP